MNFENLGRKLDNGVDKAKGELDEAKSTLNGLDKKEKKWLKIFGYTAAAIICILLLSTCVASCSKAKTKTVTIDGVQYPVDQNGIPYQQGMNGQGYVPAPGYQNYGAPIAPAAPGFWTGALLGGGLGYLAGSRPVAPPVYHAPTSRTDIYKTYNIQKPIAPVANTAAVVAKPTTPAMTYPPAPTPKVKNPGDKQAEIERQKMKAIEDRKAQLRASQAARVQSNKSGFNAFSQRASAPSRSSYSPSRSSFGGGRRR